MTARSRLVEPSSVDEITVRAYHRCATGAAGSVQGPGDARGYWWIEGDELRMVSTDLSARGWQAAAIMRELGVRPADAARAAQDARAEAPDL